MTASLVAIGTRGICSDVMEAGRINVLLVDDHPLFRRGLAYVLGTMADVFVVAEAGDASEALRIAKSTPIDVAVVDILMPDTSGISMTTELYEIQPRCRVLGLSVIDDPGLIADMLRARACGHALKTQPVEEIVEAIREVASGLRYLPPGVSADAVDRELARAGSEPFQRLTRREREVFELLIRGCSNDEIASRLFIARRTVETHRHRVNHKLSVHSLAELQRIAARHGGLGD